MDQHDPITLEIIESNLQAAADEMFAVMRKTAMSPIIYEVLDMGTGVTDADGELLSSGAGIPMFVGTLDFGVKAVIDYAGDTVSPGDVFLTNDPFDGGVTHLNDVIVAMPVFAANQVVAWTANIAHWSDLGGMEFGSVSVTAESIYQEGLRISPQRIVSKGKTVEPLLELLRNNCRLADFLEGDLWAGIAAARVGAKRLEEVIDKHGIETFLAASSAYLDRGEAITIQALGNLKPGALSISEEQDDGRVFNASLEIGPDHFLVDLTGNPPQDSGPFNITRDLAIINARMILQSLTGDPEICNSGSFRPLEVKTEPGSIFHAEPPAAMGYYYETAIRLYDLLWKCVASNWPGHFPAGHFGSVSGTKVIGTHPTTGRPYALVGPNVGGWGARDDADGPSAMFSGAHGDTYNCPAEISETRYGVDVLKLALNDEPGGAGRYRGGKGVHIEYRVRSETARLYCANTRYRLPPWPLDGGERGTCNFTEVVDPTGSTEKYSSASGVELRKGDVVRVITGSGGGYGDPKERPKKDVLNDLKNGYETKLRAVDVYGVSLE